jgi:hypothetical protein
VRAYKHNPNVNLIIRQSSPSELENAKQKDQFQTVMKKTALGMFKCLNRKSKESIKDAEEFMQYISKNMDGRTFTIFNKLLDELRCGVLAKPHVTADSFLVFLDKIRNITPSPHLNELVI